MIDVIKAPEISPATDEQIAAHQKDSAELVFTSVDGHAVHADHDTSLSVHPDATTHVMDIENSNDALARKLRSLPHLANPEVDGQESGPRVDVVTHDGMVIGVVNDVGRVAKFDASLPPELWQVTAEEFVARAQELGYVPPELHQQCVDEFGRLPGIEAGSYSYTDPLTFNVISNGSMRVVSRDYLDDMFFFPEACTVANPSTPTWAARKEQANEVTRVLFGSAAVLFLITLKASGLLDYWFLTKARKPKIVSTRSNVRMPNFWTVYREGQLEKKREQARAAQDKLDAAAAEQAARAAEIAANAAAQAARTQYIEEHGLDTTPASERHLNELPPDVLVKYLNERDKKRRG